MKKRTRAISRYLDPESGPVVLNTEEAINLLNMLLPKCRYYAVNYTVFKCSVGVFPKHLVLLYATVYIYIYFYDVIKN